MNLDGTDLGIITHLQNNARLSNKELANLVGLAPSSCLTRVRSLINQGIFRKFTGEVEPKSVGVEIQAMLTITLNLHSQSVFNELTDHLRIQPEVHAFYHLSGINDVLVHVMMKNTEHLRDFVMDKITSRDEVARCDTSLVYDSFRNSQVPFYRSSD